MAVIEFKHDLNELIKLSAKSAEEGKFILCVHNLLDGLKIAKDEKEKSAVYKCFADMFAGIGNGAISSNALFRACMEADKGGFYSINFEKFYPYTGIIAEDELPIPDSDAILGYNDVYNFFVTGQYDKGLDILCELPPDIKSLDEVIGVLFDAIEDGAKIDLSKHAYKLLILAGLYSMKSGEFVRLMLQGADITRDIMLNGVDFFVTEIEDKRILTDIAEAFVDEGEYECAEKCFLRIIQDCEIDETALFYLSAIYFHRGNEADANKYWNIYKLVYAMFGAPIQLFEKMFSKKIVPSYGTISSAFVKDDIECLSDETKDVIEKNQALVNVLSFVNDAGFVKIINKLDICEENNSQMAKFVLVSPYVSDERKRRILSELIRSGYEGRMAICFDNKGEIFDCIKFCIRNNRAIWNLVFERVSVGVICAKEFIPYRPSFLGVEIKEFAKKCNELHITMDKLDVHFLCAIIATNYNGKAKKENNIGWLNDIIPALSPEELRHGLEKFPPEVIKI